MRFYASHKKGFTLYELLVVFAIIGVLASVVIVSLNEARKKARDTQRMSDLQQVQLALRQYKDVYGRYPDYPEGTKLSALMEDYDGDADNGKGGELKKFFSTVITDPSDTSAPEDTDPVNIPSDYVYIYYSKFICEGATPRAILVALNMEQPQNANWQGTMGGCPDSDGGIMSYFDVGENMYISSLSGGENTYILILK